MPVAHGDGMISASAKETELSDDIRESDWKLLRELRRLALDRLCTRVLDEMVAPAENRRKSAHERYLAVFKLMKERDLELAAAFDNPKRSMAVMQLMCMRRLGLLTDDEFACFSDETRARVEMMNS